MNSNYSTESQVTEQFRQAMQAAGIYYSGEIIADGQLHRIRHEDHKNGTLNCAYVLHVDGKPAGYFENWSTGTKQTWTNRKTVRSYHAFSKQITDAKILRQKEQVRKHAAAAIKAVNIWSRSKPITAQKEHAYLVNKRIQPHGARIYKGALVIPIYNESDELVNLQFINSQGDKRFLSGGRKRGCFHVIGDLSQRILICEGFADGASLFEESGQRTVIAFDAGNLLPVAKNIRELAPDTEVIICGDNDLSGTGQTAARQAALAIAGKILIPQEPGMDWNDVLTGGSRNA
ncbi:MAG: toprim domain-containing protein [Nitrosomonas sp.]|uniref:toprim domain-containing protein n=1 Tax=Nitrosomonas sp. TaxID=42353 RepID=UPI0027357AD1|nr:toprim domain-containing protein [Nitrosomonas sp.]MDP3279952.1 toprim domain-containing protein [Nitrosomonas sp.]MDP3663839.1 toprim domain-containing protein [Nitrosomonas sp.]MDZ4105657.1 toprim domain-containing protein [Nitrosomonas sp.]